MYSTYKTTCVVNDHLKFVATRKVTMSQLQCSVASSRSVTNNIL